MTLPRPVLFIIIYYVASSTAEQLHFDTTVEELCSCLSNTTILPNIPSTFLSNISLQLDSIEHLRYRNTAKERIVHLSPSQIGFKNSQRLLQKRALNTTDRLRRGGDPTLTFSDAMEVWIHVVLHGVLGFIGAASTIAIGVVSAMWWYTTTMATRKAKNEKRTQRLEEIMYRNQQGGDEFEQSPMCPICLEDFLDLADLVNWPDQMPAKKEDFVRENATRVLLCGHKYHNVCIRQWLQRNDSCPICRLDHPVQSSPKHWCWLNWQRISCKTC